MNPTLLQFLHRPRVNGFAWGWACGLLFAALIEWVR